MSHRPSSLHRSFKFVACCSVATFALAPYFAGAYEGNVSALPKIAFPEAQEAPRQIPVENQQFASFAPSAEPAVMPAREPLAALPEPMALTPAALPELPPVDPAIEAQARREIEQQTAMLSPPPAPAVVPPVSQPDTQIVSYPVPAPLAASTLPPPPPAPEPLIPALTTGEPARPEISQLPKIIFPPLQPEPLSASATEVAKVEPLPAQKPAAQVAAPKPSAEPVEPLSNASKRVLAGIPSKLDTKKSTKTRHMDIERMSPEIKSLIGKTPEIETFDATGLSIRVQRPGLDTNYELNRAYNALMGGNSAEAIDIYKNILSAEPGDEEALFGVAATYHRLGDLEHARPYYAELLRINPQHREGLNNFLALISDEAPEEALAELERLEQRNPQFSPIPAQQGVVLNKLGYFDQAREKMLRAIELAPENLTYKHNLAIMLDQHGEYRHASALYRLLIDAALKGEKLPTSLEALQKRLNFISAAMAPRNAAGG